MGARTGGFALPSYTTTGNTTFLGDGAGEGNRTLVFSLEGCCSTIELHPRQGLPNTAGRRSQLPRISGPTRSTAQDQLPNRRLSSAFPALRTAAGSSRPASP